MNNIFEADKVVNKEFFSAYGNINIADARGYVNLANDDYKIDCRGYNYFNVYISQLSEDTALEVRGGLVTGWKKLPIFNLINGERTYEITAAGNYIIPVSEAIDAGIYCNTDGSSRSVNITIGKLCSAIDILPKNIQIASGIVECNNANNTTIVALSNINISDYRFLVIRCKTVPGTGETDYVRRTASMSIEYNYPASKHTFHKTLESDVFTLNDESNKVSDWISTKGMFATFHVKCPDATGSATKKFELTIIGVR